jgi:probable HAF family extracellular repeat protein
MGAHWKRITVLGWLGAIAGTAGIATGQVQPAGKAEASVAHGAPVYTVINIAEGVTTILPKMNRSGQVAFSVQNQDGHRAKFFDGRTIRDLGNLGLPESYAADLNDAGQVVGYSKYREIPEFTYLHGFRWSAATGMVDLGALPGTVYSEAHAINNRNEVVGYSYFNGVLSQRLHAVRWNAGNAIFDLGTLYGSSVASDINDAGQVTGGTGTPDGHSIAFFWDPRRGMVGLGSLGGGDSSPAAINASGQIAGESSVGGGDHHAFLWNPWGRLIDLGTFGGDLSYSTDLNDSGAVVGVSRNARGDDRAFISYNGSRMRDLGTFGGYAAKAWKINRYGQVVGRAAVRGYEFHAFSWTPSHGMIDLNRRLAITPPGLVVQDAFSLGDNGAIVAESNAGLVVLLPGTSTYAAPVAGPISGRERIPLGQQRMAAVRFVDANRGDTHRATWSWGDGSPPEAAILRETHGQGVAYGKHTYRQAGSYPVVLTVTDSTGRKASVSRLLYACDPSAGVACEVPGAAASSEATAPAGGN